MRQAYYGVFSFFVKMTFGISVDDNVQQNTAEQLKEQINAGFDVAGVCTINLEAVLL